MRRNTLMNKKMIAPLVIGVLLASYFICVICVIFWMDVHGGAIVLIGIPLIALLLLWVKVVKERIDEIRSGEEDDLSKY